MYKNYLVKEMGSDGFWDQLGRSTLPYSGNRNPLRSILQAMQEAPLSCQTVVFESDYVDEVYQDEYSVFYSKAFKSYPDRCTRLHFFSCRIPKRVRTNFEQYSKFYLGFMVLRPTDLQRVGRTILKPQVANPDTDFINCVVPFNAHIMGQRFSVQAMPFIQQDTQVGSCAQASLWMLSRYMSKRFGNRRFMPSEINEFAKAKLGLGRHLPAENGLNMSQMLEALESMGFSAVAYMRNSIDQFSRHIETAYPLEKDAKGKVTFASLNRQRTAKLADVAYRYIESGFPVVFGTSNHALVGIGHKYEYNANAQVAIERIPAFYVNNDNCGCYREMPIFGPCNEYEFDKVNSLIAVTPREATLRGESAEDMARTSIENFLTTIPDQNKPETYADILVRMRPDFSPWFSQLEYRTFMLESVAFQEDIRAQMRARELDRKVAEKLLRLDYPRYIWLTEVSSSSLLNKINRAERKCLGRIVVDSTAPAHTRGVIAMHFADILFLYNRHQGTLTPDIGFYPNSTPFHHKLWKGESG